VDAQGPGWLKFIGEVFANNLEPGEMIRFMQEVFAYSLSGSVSEQKIFCYLGDGSNGKSITLNALKRISGAYSTIATAAELTLSSDSFSKEFERIGSRVAGHRIVVVDDFKMSGSWNEGFIKVLTGKEILSRKLYQEATTQPNHAKFHIGMNKAPKPEEENKGLLRRLCFIPFRRPFEPDPVKEQELNQMLEEEASGILLWALQAYERVAKRGISYPDETLAALEEYRQDNFKGETALENMYEFPKTECKEGSWVRVGSLVEEVNAYFHAQGDMFERLNAEKLGHMFKRSGALKKRGWDPEIRNTVTCVFVRKRPEGLLKN
jgi:putative DNA primase/helicase